MVKDAVRNMKPLFAADPTIPEGITAFNPLNAASNINPRRRENHVI
jgi:hypothetical protein